MTEYESGWSARAEGKEFQEGQSSDWKAGFWDCELTKARQAQAETEAGNDKL